MKTEQSMISSGDNFPDFNPAHDSTDLFLISLHKHLPISEFKQKTNFSEDKINRIITFLESKNWLHQVNNQPLTSVFIADAKDGEQLLEYARPMASEITTAIKGNLPSIKEKFLKTSISKNQSFHEWSFFILSDVLLDSWQINSVESQFLKQANRPERNGKNYYYSIMEKSSEQREAFGIYGNQTETIQDKSISVYGNNRAKLVISKPDHKISGPDNLIFDSIARDFLPALLTILEKNRTQAEIVYKKLGYSEEITFDEFFIWWYHIIYTQATNLMNEKKMLVIPESGNFEYELL
jgi:hypothetical protein